ncbi:Protein of unknown function UPF0179 [Methanohalobium evestigatum Z-7303]|uniref:UPF0179 protein Metev_0561 n=1 Tax=Methanohalobium evestigatum (strain ATCC BAA-1072 / DSM 3721 / NBRC 107634 / OCM 161 / Z-7303) TaxID=644295 RepID=D7E8D0_METEZ|nr:UPF0179 family protein [Methanohalobium evestigatum]ADI73472.1 Protein of unknown function UPF0179 [Methanohalobium evestigatum Z-7303]
MVNNESTKVTLVGCRLAKEGQEFIYWGESPDCSGCKIKGTCNNLEAGRKYRVEKIRNGTVHGCYLHDQGVMVVEVSRTPVVATIESKKAVPGAKINFEPIKCSEINCEFYGYCYPKGLKSGDKCTIVNVMDDVDECLRGKSLKKVELSL